ncbi:DUF3089 domain-containing protein [Hymenobacter sp. PAMC 26628]|uniref:DUF3089 domain-containing protein n=1 Tax=Hymenobacter sp. PAMC 26628 TaxID=1484118 RepID=UPI00077067B3|nr:DUF3089 domain-containing protein [Hymenobacter sp. PAMC 26628]AMJ67013.1 hypothetical protein AXW84_17420 [Hymenobacter sp. PAMC 26628]
MRLPFYVLPSHWAPRLAQWWPVALLACTSCISLLKPAHGFTATTPAPAPDYAQESSWAALPTRRDSADALPRAAGLRDGQATAAADVFFIHPTSYYWRGSWNADVGNARLNRYTDRTTIFNQASVFNAAGRVYAPRYRQATLYSFFDKQGPDGQKALDLAYADVKAAFQYYLAHYNQGRPIIIAGHSQGATHATRLLHDFFDNDPALRKRLAAAYLIGCQAKTNEYQTIRPCPDSLATGCFVAWNTSERGFDYPPYHGLVATNPLTWTLDTLRAPAALNRGGVGPHMKRIDAHVTDAQSHRGLLWITAPKVRGYPRFFLPGYPELRHSFHAADYGLFYLNIRENAAARVRAWERTYKTAK